MNISPLLILTINFLRDVESNQTETARIQNIESYREHRAQIVDRNSLLAILNMHRVIEACLPPLPSPSLTPSPATSRIIDNYFHQPQKRNVAALHRHSARTMYIHIDIIIITWRPISCQLSLMDRVKLPKLLANIVAHTCRSLTF